MTVNIRREIRLLNNVSKDKVLPISLVPKAEWVGKLKEAEIWKSVDELLDSKQEDQPDEPADKVVIIDADQDVVMKDE